MDLLLDTQVLVWLGTGDRRLSRTVRDAVVDPETTNFVSAVSAWEYADLNARGKFGSSATPFGSLLRRFEAIVLSIPESIWIVATKLPIIYKDPVDRMLVAHAMLHDMAIATADRDIPDYDVRTLW